MEGEYYESRIPKAHDAIISWFKFSIDNEEYNFRTVYSYNKNIKKDIQSVIADSLEQSIKNISLKIKL